MYGIHLKFLVLCSIAISHHAFGSEASWQMLTPQTYELPPIGNGKVQTAIVFGDFDKDRTTDLIVGFSDQPPALVLLSHGTNWQTLSIELEAMKISPGGFAFDLDRDDDLDLIAATTDGAIFWWENPSPNFDPARSWTRHLIRKADGNPIWGQLIGDFMGNGELQLLFWNQHDSCLYAAALPSQPSPNEEWAIRKIFDAPASGFNNAIPLGLSAGDINIDAQIDIIASSFWLKRNEDGTFKPTLIGRPGGIIAMGRFNEGTYPQFASTTGGLTWLECRVEPGKSRSWGSHELLSEPVSSVLVADFNRDDREDILVSNTGNLIQPASLPKPNNITNPKTWIFYGDGKGNFKPTLLPITTRWQTIAAADLNRDGGLDLVGFTAGGEPHLEIWLNQSTPQARPTAPLKTQ
jgi:hypothetical protein